MCLCVCNESYDLYLYITIYGIDSMNVSSHIATYKWSLLAFIRTDNDIDVNNADNVFYAMDNIICRLISQKSIGKCSVVLDALKTCTLDSNK